MVILFVRMWVEMHLPVLWSGRDSCHPLREDVSWNNIVVFFCIVHSVILFVRMWVEITTFIPFNEFIRSSSSWGCELKYTMRDSESVTHCHPLREDVSWNVPALNVMVGFVVILFVRMWVEIPFRQPNQLLQSRHPLREDVSWNDAENAKGGESISHPLREDVSWNINRWGGERMYDSHPLREDVSWNLEEYGVNHRCSNMVLLVRRWIEISLIFFLSFARRSHYYTLFNLNIKLNYRNLRGNFYMCS